MFSVPLFQEEEGEEDEEVYREQDEPQPKRSRTDEKVGLTINL